MLCVGNSTYAGISPLLNPCEKLFNVSAFSAVVAFPAFVALVALFAQFTGFVFVPINDAQFFSFIVVIQSDQVIFPSLGTDHLNCKLESWSVGISNWPAYPLVLSQAAWRTPPSHVGRPSVHDEEAKK